MDVNRWAVYTAVITLYLLAERIYYHHVRCESVSKFLCGYYLWADYIFLYAARPSSGTAWDIILAQHAILRMPPGPNDSFFVDLPPHTPNPCSAWLGTTLVWTTENIHLWLKITALFYRWGIALAFAMEIDAGNSAFFTALCKFHLKS